ncbi:MAG TPA: hypothetical protein VMH80_15340 [Bryobacteraceae bacterium]|nr:hypothetical protein [Bryobacteraceae bacterium]
MNTQQKLSIQLIGAFCLAANLAGSGGAVDAKPVPRKAQPVKLEHFETSDRCIACHNGISTSLGEDVSVGFKWRATMMANSARDPYWQAGVRRETIDHPMAKAEIENECAICHMPMARYESMLAGHEQEVFGHARFDPSKPADRFAADGVSCSLCHQITDQKLGTRESFVGGFVIDTTPAKDDRKVYGPYEIDAGHVRIMRSSAGFQPTQAKHIRQSELCATCHTLLTKALGKNGEVIGELPEQVPYQEWLESDYKETKSCQSCHMPVVAEQVPVTSVLGKPREAVSMHSFVGGNFFLQRLLNRYRDELSVQALPQELDAAATRTITHLQAESARITIEKLERRDDRMEADIAVQNLGGHKLPTAYPSRRVWLHVSVRDANGKCIFESGAINPQGMIEGNDNDADAGRYEPHYTEIRSPDQVQIYEAIMGDSAGKPTTGLLNAIGYLKDNRLLPSGFDKSKADKDVAVHGAAANDPDFTGGGDRIRYSIAVAGAAGPFRVEAELWYQPLAYRWAANLRQYDAFEPRRFIGYYEALAPGSAVMLVKASMDAR